MMKTIKAILATITFSTGVFIFSGNTFAGDGMNVTPISSEKKATVELKSPKSIDVSVFATDDDHIKTTTDVKVNQSAVQVLSNDVEHKPIFFWKGGSIMVNDLNIESEDIRLP